MTILKRFILMIQFLTTIPLPVGLNVNEKDFGKGLIFAPAVGLVIGAILAGLYNLLLLVFPPAIIVVLIIVFYMLLTGGLHLDGLGDTFDGLFSNRSKERMLEIMRDSRVGTNAVLAIICVVLLNWAVIGQINSEDITKVLLLMPVAGRIGSLVGAGVSKYARSGEGLGKSFIDYCGAKEIVIGLSLCAVAFYTIIGLKGLVFLLLSSITAFILVKFLSRKIGGATGDILGAVCELNQTIFLIAAYIMLK